MSMLHAKDFSAEFPRSGLKADGPDWDAGIDTSVWRPDMGAHPLGDPKAELPSMTKQEFAEECDINHIMARYEKTGVMPVGTRMFEFGEAISEYSYQESMNAVIASREYFASLPARIRDRFGNDPGKLFAFLDDEDNRDEAIELGLVKEPDPEPAPVKVEVTNSSPPKPDAP